MQKVCFVYLSIYLFILNVFTIYNPLSSEFDTINNKKYNDTCTKDSKNKDINSTLKL